MYTVVLLAVLKLLLFLDPSGGGTMSPAAEVYGLSVAIGYASEVPGVKLGAVARIRGNSGVSSSIVLAGRL